MRYLFAYWRDFSETCHKHSSCEWALLAVVYKVTDQGESEVSGRGIHFNGVALRLVFTVKLWYYSEEGTHSSGDEETIPVVMKRPFQW